MQLASCSIDVLADVTAPFRALPTLGRAELMRARRRGADLHELVESWWARYEEAWTEAERRANEAAKQLELPPMVFGPVLIDAAARVGPPSRWSHVIEREVTTVTNGARAPRDVAVIVPRARAREHRPAAARRTSSSSRTASQDPGDGDPEPADGPWALSLVDRAPLLWRFRALRCRYMERREGVVE
jgi:hypothetical protein